MKPVTAFLGRQAVLRAGYTSSRWNSNYAFFCRQCGETWGLIHTGDDRRYPIIVSCESCGPSRFMDYAGSFLVCNEPEMLSRFDGESWDREVRDLCQTLASNRIAPLHEAATTTSK